MQGGRRAEQPQHCSRWACPRRRAALLKTAAHVGTSFRFTAMTPPLRSCRRSRCLLCNRLSISSLCRSCHLGCRPVGTRIPLTTAPLHGGTGLAGTQTRSTTEAVNWNPRLRFTRPREVGPPPYAAMLTGACFGPAVRSLRSSQDEVLSSIERLGWAPPCGRDCPPLSSLCSSQSWGDCRSSEHPVLPQVARVSVRTRGRMSAWRMRHARRFALRWLTRSGCGGSSQIEQRVSLMPLLSVSWRASILRPFVSWQEHLHAGMCSAWSG